MKASRAYITGLGTTGVLLCFALLLLVVVSAIVTFRGWPAGAAGEDSAAVSVGSDNGSPAAPVRREVAGAPRAARARAARRAARAKRTSRDRGRVRGTGASGSQAPGEVLAGRARAPAPAAPTRPTQQSQGSPQVPGVTGVPEAPETPKAPDVGQVSSGLADTTQQVTEGASGAVGDVGLAPLDQTVSDTGHAVSDVVEQTGNTTQQQLQQTVDTTQQQLQQLPQLP